MIKAEHKPYFIVLLLFGLHYLSAYPGGMSPDTLTQYSQSLSFDFISSNPPIMAMFWSVLNFIYKGPQLMLLVQLCFLWGGILLLYNSNPDNKYKKLYFILPFLPHILSQSATIWKDVVFAFSFFFVVSSCIYYTYKKEQISFLKLCGLVLISFYGMAVKFQAQFIVIILIFWVISLAIKRSLWIRLVIASVVSFVMISTNLYVINVNSTKANWWQLRAVFDIAGISMQTGNDELFPDYIKEDELYDYNKLKDNFSHKTVDYIFFEEKGRIFRHSFDPKKSNSLQQSFNEAILKHPFYYLYHRMAVFSYTLKSCYFYHYAFLDDIEAKNRGIHKFKKEKLKRVIVHYLKAFPRFLPANAFALLLVLFYAFQLFSKRQLAHEPEYNVLKYITLLSLGHTIVILFTVMSSDYRYYYVVRVLSFMAIPIYLQLRAKAKSKG